MKNLMKRYRVTILGFIVAVTVFAISTTYKIDLFEKLVTTLHKIEKYEVDEILVSVFIFLMFVFIDFARRERLKKIEHEKIKVYQAMLSSSHHVLNNFLNKMQLFKMTAENYIGFPKEVLNIYDNIFETALEQMEALSKVTDINEENITRSVLKKINQ